MNKSIAILYINIIYDSRVRKIYDWQDKNMINDFEYIFILRRLNLKFKN
jgi:hypothetical protein